MTEQTEQTEITSEELVTAREIATAAQADPLLHTDCDGTLRVWRESALLNVARDDNGAVTGWREPFSYRPSDLILDAELDSWDEGEDEEDDRLRQAVRHMVAAYALMPALLAEVERLAALEKALAEYRQAAEIDHAQAVAPGPDGANTLATVLGAHGVADLPVGGDSRG